MSGTFHGESDIVDMDRDEPKAIATFEGLIDIEERKRGEQTVIRYTGSPRPER